MLQKLKFLFLVLTTLWLLFGDQCPQVHGESDGLVMFDDQYIGCSDKLEKYVMPGVLQKEKANKQFKEAWINATEHWEEIKDGLQLPEGFEDEYGIALLVFTNKYPAANPIHQQLNGNLSIAGASRTNYMKKFHFKALHFYLTRALQVLKPNCDVPYTTYRGSEDSFVIPTVARFGRFTSSSLSLETAQTFGTETFFRITTCFGAKIGDFSFFPEEEEVLIPPTEKFEYVAKHHSNHILKSIGKMCSFYNCAYLGEERREVAECRSDTSEDLEEENPRSDPTSVTAVEERMSVLEAEMSLSVLYRDVHTTKINEIIDTLNGKLLAAMRELEGEVKALGKLSIHSLLQETKCENNLQKHQDSLTSMQEELQKLQDLTALIPSLQNKETIIMKHLLHHRKSLTSLQEDMKKQQDMFLALVTFAVIAVSIKLLQIFRPFFNQLRIPATRPGEQRMRIIRDAPQEYDPRLEVQEDPTQESPVHG